MKCDIVDKKNNELIITSQSGNVIKCGFENDENKKAVDTVLNNLMTSYEERINGCDLKA